MSFHDVGGGRVGGGVVEQQVRAAAVRDAVVRARHAVPGLVLELREDVGVVRHERGVHRLDAVAVDEPQRGVAGGGHDVVLAGGEQLHGLGGRGEGLDGDLAAGLLLEGRHPVDGRVRRAVLGVAGPGETDSWPSPGADGSGVGRGGRGSRGGAARRRPRPRRHPHRRRGRARARPRGATVRRGSAVVFRRMARPLAVASLVVSVSRRAAVMPPAPRARGARTGARARRARGPAGRGRR